jgi:hypothetical protein
MGYGGNYGSGLAIVRVVFGKPEGLKWPPDGRGAPWAGPLIDRSNAY